MSTDTDTSTDTKQHANLSDPLFTALAWAIKNQSAEHCATPLAQWFREARSDEERGAVNIIKKATERGHWVKADKTFAEWLKEQR